LRTRRAPCRPRSRTGSRSSATLGATPVYILGGSLHTDRRRRK
jgi:hypothetical protein